MKLSSLLDGVKHKIIDSSGKDQKKEKKQKTQNGQNHDLSVEITGITLDSRKVKRGYLFFAVKGVETDGHKFIGKAVENGASAVVITDPEAVKAVFTVCDEQNSFDKDIPIVLVEDVHKAMADISNNFYHQPSDKMTIFGVTGTNGKTTTTNIIRYILEKGLATPIPCGYIGTIGIRYGDKSIAPTMTTPDLPTLQNYLSDMADAGMRAVAMEVSSHGLAMGRVEGIHFNVAAFTNLTHDHLDYHGTMEEYFRAKQLLFKGLSSSAVAILNADDEVSIGKLREVSKGEIFTYGMNKDFEGNLSGSREVSLESKDPADTDFEAPDYMISDLELRGDGSLFTLEVSGRAMDAHRKRIDPIIRDNDGAFGKAIYQIETNLLAKYNIYNLVAAIACVHQRGIQIEDFKKSLTEISQVDGRMESIANDKGINVIIDYAHTVDAMEKVYEFVDAVCDDHEKRGEIRPKVYSVFGSAGKRDKSKRPGMGKTAFEHSTHVFLTEDDPRDEDPEDIAKEIKGDLPEDRVTIIPDRIKAMEEAISRARKGDFVMILGKGEDMFMARDDRRDPWDGDNVIAKRILEK